MEGLEIRKLDYVHKKRLGEIMAVNDDWKHLMAIIPRRDPSGAADPFELPSRASIGNRRFTSEEVAILDRAYKNGAAQSGLELLIEEWGTMGKVRPKVRDLLRLCLEMKAVAAASYISESILCLGPIVPGPEADNALPTLDNGSGNPLPWSGVKNDRLGNGAVSAATSSHIRNGDVDRLRRCPGPDLEELDAILEEDLNANCGSAADQADSDFLTHPGPAENALPAHRVPFGYLVMVTDGFADDRIIGKGGFAQVYLGITLRSKVRIAVKRLRSSAGGGGIGARAWRNGGGDQGHLDRHHQVHHLDEAAIQQLNYEVDQLPRLKHPNIIDLLGYSNDSEGPVAASAPAESHCCLLYPYMPNGTLEKALLRYAGAGRAPLSAAQRMRIALGVAKGLDHIHTQPKVLIHRDIKSSNILLDENLLPKIADFGLLRYAVSGEGDTCTYTQTAKGTPAYMPPEAIMGDLSAKWDVWSYGVVLLELLTGLAVLDRAREDQDLTTYILGLASEPGFNLQAVLDANCKWAAEDATLLYKLSEACLSRSKRDRPTMSNVVASIYAGSSTSLRKSGSNVE